MSTPEHTRPDAWSRRRKAVQAEAEALERQKRQSQIAARHQDLAQLSDAEVLAELDLPEPESLEAGDDFTAFMKEAVPSAIRNRALRKLWLSNPVLANVDELVDYGEDFAAEAKLSGVIKTLYRVGKGMLADTPDEVPSGPPVAAEAEVEEDQPEAEVLEIAAVAEPETEVEAPPPTTRNRMRFEFAEVSTAPHVATEQGQG